MTEPKFLIVDGSSLLYRAFFALPLLQTKQGLYTNAVYGFTTMLLRLLEEEKPDYAVVAFDRPTPTFRHLEYKEYKAKREKTPSELSEQAASVREILSALHIPVMEMDGYEADDLIGTISRQSNLSQIKPVIVTGDADIFQLVDLPAEVIYTRRGITQVERYDHNKLHERYGLSASQFIDYKGLKGDPSDNIPGVPGVGEKTAIKLLQQFGTMDGIYEHLAEIPGKLKETLAQHQEQAYLSKRLATIITDMPVELKPDDFRRREPDYDRLRVIFEQLEFKSLLERLPSEQSATEHKTLVQESFSEVKASADWERFSAAVARAGEAAIITEPAGASWQSALAGIAVALPAETFYIPFHFLSERIEQAGRIFLSEAFTTIAYDAKTWINICVKIMDAEPAGPVFDVALAAYLIDPLQSGYPPEKLSSLYLDRQLPVAPGKRKSDTDCSRDYFCCAVRALYQLYPVLRSKLRELELEELYDTLEMPLASVLAKMERHGIAVDIEELARLKTQTAGRIETLESEIYLLAEMRFNLNSPKQLAHVLFEKLKLPAFKKTKTGYSTDAEVLEELAGQHEVAAKILEYRMLVKLQGTYLEGLSKLVRPDSGRIHTTFNQTVTATGRLSSTEPNLQNIPIRLEEGRRVRRAFVPGRTGVLLLSADYSQIELRILAHLSADKVLISSFLGEEDIHRRTAAEVFSVPPEEVTREMRDRAKAVNFGIIYGISDYGLSRQLSIPRHEAKLYIERYLERYPAVRDYFVDVVKEAHAKGYVTTILNRRRYLPEINSKNFVRRSFAERTAMNTPIQGSAADIIKLAMLNVQSVLDKFNGSARMILQVHDELVFEVEENSLSVVAADVRREMECAIPLLVPLTVDFKAGPNWAEMQKL
ncbi:MAG: DNA polymerase I [Dethiobacter sp.]|jgi:DNA polymerase-1|nr:DNA polymerase I [Dethiobacter sp.]